jgi:tripartite-type tricarboxylate transporter receptor subunit TctC
VGIIRTPNVMVVNPLVPVKTVPEFISYARANPGRMNMASAGSGTSPHIAGELFKMMAGVDMLHVPYRGGASAIIDLIAGRVHVYFPARPVAIEHIRAGRLRPLAVTSATRSEMLPPVPVVGDFLPGYEASSWYGLAAPRNTPFETVTKLNDEVNAALADPAIKARLNILGASILGGSPAEFGKLITNETEKWSQVIRAANITPD